MPGLPAGGVDQDVLGLDVPVDHVALVGDPESLGDLEAVGQSLGCIEGADPRDPLLEGFPLDVLEHDVGPALVLAGEHDRLTPPQAGRELAEQLPLARFQLIRRSGHAPFLSHPGEVLAEITAFLARHAPEEAS